MTLTLNNELGNLLVATRTDGGDDAGRADADRGSVDTARDMEYLRNRPTLYMTATWGN